MPGFFKFTKKRIKFGKNFNFLSSFFEKHLENNLKTYYNRIVYL